MTGRAQISAQGEHYMFNVVYAYQPKEGNHAVHKGNVSVIWTRRPIHDAHLHLYLNAYSYTGPMPGLNILLLSEPVAVLPGQYDPAIWSRFDYVVTLYDALIENYPGFSKCLFYRTGLHAMHTTPDSAITENLAERDRLYPIEGRINGICMVNGNKQFIGPGELYSKRIEAALWFYRHSDIPFDVYGNPPFFLPSYKGSLPVGERLATMSHYRYGLCFENTLHSELSRGYVEKIFDCLEARVVPIYLGAPDIEKYVPKECFIDFRDFKNYEELHKFLNGITDERYRSYIKNIDRFVVTGGLRPYTWNRLYDELIDIFSERALGSVLVSDSPTTISDWEWGMSPSHSGENVLESDSQPLWSFELHASTPSPIVAHEPGEARPGNLTQQERVDKATALMNGGKNEEAIDAFAYTGGGGTAELHYLYAQLLFATGRHDAAKIHLEITLAANNRHSKALNDLGALFLAKGEVKRSVELFHQAIASDNKNYNAVDNLINVLTRVNQISYASDFLTDIMRSSPQDRELKVIATRYGLPLRDGSAHSPEQPAPCAQPNTDGSDRTAADHSSGSGLAEITALQREGKFGEAIELLQPILARHGENPDVHYLHSQLLNSSGDKKASSLELLRTIALNPKHFQRS